MIKELVQEVKDSVNFSRKEDEFIGNPSMGDNTRQGDLYIVFIPRDAIGASAKRTENRQLAEGNTQGSRHIMEGDVEIYTDHGITGDYIKQISNTRNDIPNDLVGPAIVFKGESNRLSHPEHGHKIIPGDLCGVVVYQSTLSGNLRRRVQD